ncbi:hypothetical protein HPB48_004882 [Haemaphysalis longicornis]|uniref:Uncharacterized protein n=1 Tax=Haemaphysalis longicornis TaxID=44386 RepID=A0A9J6GE86_HAELO|nr:hypothetical protein HPB48_004882 [Haemaphysalis longicornis]
MAHSSNLSSLSFQEAERAALVPFTLDAAPNRRHLHGKRRGKRQAAEGFQGLRQQDRKKETVNDTAFTTTDRVRLGGSAPSQSRPPSKPTRLAWILVIGLPDLAGLKNLFSVTLFRNRGNGWRDLIDGEPPQSGPPRVLPFFSPHYFPLHEFFISPFLYFTYSSPA